VDAAAVTSERFRHDGHTLIASWVLTGPANMAACSFTAGMLAIVLSLMLYVALAAANFGKDNDQLVAMWVSNHFWLLVAETLCIIVSVLFVWACAYFVGLIKSEVQCACCALLPACSRCAVLHAHDVLRATQATDGRTARFRSVAHRCMPAPRPALLPADLQWAVIGWAGMVAVVLMSAYVVYVHLWRTIPSITADKRAQLLMQYAAEQRAAEKLGGAHDSTAGTGGGGGAGEKLQQQGEAAAAAPAGAE
jgi:hypothetical protein